MLPSHVSSGLRLYINTNCYITCRISSTYFYALATVRLNYIARSALSNTEMPILRAGIVKSLPKQELFPRLQQTSRTVPTARRASVSFYK